MIGLLGWLRRKPAHVHDWRSTKRGEGAFTFQCSTCGARDWSWPMGDNMGDSDPA